MGTKIRAILISAGLLGLGNIFYNDPRSRGESGESRSASV
jgi:hypothetical protein